MRASRSLSAVAVLVAAGLIASNAAAHPLDETLPRGGSDVPENDLTPFPAPDVIAANVETAPLQHNPEPLLQAVPRARCGPGSHPLRGTQGRVPAAAIDSPEGKRGWRCNLRVTAHHATTGGFRVWRYTDRAGRTCAFYDTSISSSLNVVRLGAGPSSGVAVLDMTNPRHPVETDRLISVPMLAPHESLNLNRRRGLLAANTGNGLTLPALMSIYDVKRDCRHPRLLSTSQPTRFGHESGFSPDGKTYWVAGGIGIAAVDVSDPRRPRTVWSGNVYAHGLNLSRDGNRLYDAEPINGNLVILDVSEIQARKPDPEVREISRLTWDPVTVPQNTAPMRIDGKPFLLEFDEFGFRFSTIAPRNQVGAARIIDISNEARPRIVSNIRLEVNQPDQHEVANDDPTPLPAPYFNYSAHYCAIPKTKNPGIAACSFINSGLRIFDISNPRRPREVGYFVAPPAASSDRPRTAANFAMSMPAFDVKRRTVWYTDATSGFYALRLSKRAWPRNP